jgi:hypothetical protein
MLDQVIDRLSSAAGPLIRSVGSGEDLAALAEGAAPADMSAFVVPFAQEPTDNERSTGAVLQRVRVIFLVAVCIRRYGDAKGAARRAATDEVDGKLEAVLLGWQPTADADPITLVGIRSQPAKNGVLWHVSTWATARYAEGVS